MKYGIDDALDSMQKLVERYGVELDYFSLQLIRDELKKRQNTVPSCFACGSKDVSFSIHCENCGADNVG
jgi:PP-loop superfamily ATP-utilizing enzyme